MGKIIVFMNLTLDGVMQAPGRPDEDTRGAFPYGGWAAPYAAMSEAGENTPNFGSLLLGRRTYEDFYSYWPKQTDSPFSEALNKMPKHIVSTTLQEPLAWSNSTLIKENVSEAIAKLKNEQDKDTVIMGSGELIRTLMKHDLIDRYVLLIHPLVLGKGHRLFTECGLFASLKLVNTEVTLHGVIISVYEPVKPNQEI